MGRKGGFSHNYDAAAMARFKANEEATAALGSAISERVLAALDVEIDALAETISADFGLHASAARLLVAQRVSEAADFLRIVKAGEARGEGIPVRGLMDAMGYSSPTSISRMVPTLDHVGAMRARVDAAGVPEIVEDDRGYTVSLTPRSDAGESVEQARKRGLLPEPE